MVKSFRRVLLLLAASLLPACALIYKLLPPPAPGVEPGSLRIDGAFARAVEVAWADLREIREQSVAASVTASDGGTPDPFNVCFARIDAYDAYVNVRENGNYVVRLIPVITRCAHEKTIVYGGGATYELAPDYTVLGKAYDE